MRPTAEPGRSSLSLILHILFFLSGFSGLVYEVLWTRRFGLSFGNTTYATTLVLSAFMGGLALGSRYLGRLADRLEGRVSGLTLYGWMEIGVGVYCLGFERILAAQDSLLLAIYRAFDPGRTATLTLKFGLAFVILLLPAILMGGTLPVLIKRLGGELRAVGRVTGSLYFINCLGAVAGALTVAFWLVPGFGVSFSYAAAAAFNIAAGVGALALRTRFDCLPENQTEADSLPETSPETVPAPATEAGLRWALVGIFVSGLTAMLYQVAWVRLLSLVLGSSTYSFALMVAAFISGIALGSLLVARFMERVRSAAALFGLCQTGIGLAVLAMLPTYSRLPLFFLASREAVNFGYGAHEIFKYVVCLVVMLVPTTLFGMGFPLVSRLAARSVRGLAGRIGNVYALNTAGNILGAALGGLALIPLVGLKSSLEIAVALNLATGATILLALGPERRQLARRALIVSAAGAALYLGLAPGWDRQLLTSGVYRIHAVGADAAAHLAASSRRELLFYREGVSAVVTVEHSGSLTSLTVNGKTDASTGLDMPTQLLQAHLPMLLHPAPQRVLVIGAGSGVTCGAALAHPELQRLVCVEISPEVLDASRLFAPWNRRYWEDPRVRCVVEDGREYVFRGPEQFEVITSEPSNPWIAGIGNLYTREFYSCCRARLTADGVFCQWIHLYEMEEGVLKTILRTFLEAFPQAVAFSSVENNDLLLIGPAGALSVDFAALERRMAQPEVAADLRGISLDRPFVLLTTQVFDNPALRRWAGIGPLNTDNFPRVEYLAPRGFFLAERVILPERDRLSQQGSTLLRQWLNYHTPQVQDFLDLARYQGRSGYTGMMYAALQDALALEPRAPQALELLARLLTGRKKYAEAAAVLDSLNDTAALSAAQMLNLRFPVALALDERSAASFVHPPDFSLSLAIKSALADLEPARSLHRFDLGDILCRMGDYARAEAQFDAALELRDADTDPSAPDRAILLQRAGQAALEAGAFDRAAAWFARYAGQFPDDPLGPAMQRLVILERLGASGQPVDAATLRKALGD